MQLIDGKKIAQEFRQKLKTQIETISGRKPGLAFILIGKDPASQAYVRMKKKDAKMSESIQKYLSFLKKFLKMTFLKKSIASIKMRRSTESLFSNPFQSKSQ